MSPIATWARRCWYLLNRRRLETALQEEMEAHRALMGQPQRFGNTLQLRERSRDVWGWGSLDALVRDVRLAGRGLLRTPSFTLLATASLALGLALTTSTVSVVNAYLIRSLPYAESDRLYHVRYAPPGPWEPQGMTALDWQSVQDVVEYPIASASDSFYLADGGAAISLRKLTVTRGFVDGLGVKVIAGRPLGGPDFVNGAEAVALIGYGLWRERFGSSPDAIGRLVRGELESRPGEPSSLRIAGVLEPGFYYGRDSRTVIDLLVPQAAPIRTYMVRLRAGVPPAAAERRLTEAARSAATSAIPDEWTGVQLESARDRWVGTLRPVLFGVTVAVSLVLVIVCANVAVLVLLRSMRRQNEIAVRLALGSGWGHIARMLLTETFLVCAAALAAAIALTTALLATLSPLIETQLGRPAPNANGITIDTTVLLIVGGIGLLVVVALSLAPLATWGRGLTNALQQDARVASASRSMSYLRNGLIAFEIAGALVLLVGCGLMIRGVVSMMSTDLGFAPEGLTRSRIMLRARHYPDAAAYRQFHERFVASVSSATGATVVFSSWPPYVERPGILVQSDQGEARLIAGGVTISAGYLETFGVRVREGREFTAREASAEAPIAVVSDTLARQLWPGGTALGRRVRIEEPTSGGVRQGPWRTVVGIAGDVRQTYGDAETRDIYTPKMPDGRYGTFYIRSRRPVPLLSEDFTSAAAAIDRDAVIDPARLVVADDQARAGTRFLTILATVFAAIAAFLAMLGVYGVTATAVQQRRKELAIRVALGASRRAVVAIFLRQGAWLLGAGTAAGLAGAILGARVLSHQIFGVRSSEISTYAVAGAALLAAGVLAILWAARRAAAIADPVSVLNAAN